MSQADFVSGAYLKLGVTNRLKGVLMNKNPSFIQRIVATPTQEPEKKMNKTRQTA